MSSPAMFVIRTWRRWTAPTTQGELARRREAVLLNVLAALVALSVLTQTIQWWSILTTRRLSVIEWWLSDVAVGAASYGLLRLARAGRHRAAASAVVVLVLGLGLLLLVLEGPEHPMWPALVALSIVLAALSLGGQAGLIALGTSAATAVPLVVLDGDGVLTAMHASDTHNPTDTAGAVGIFAVLGVVAFVCHVYARDSRASIDESFTSGGPRSPLRQLRAARLTVREVEVVQLVAGGLTNDEIASRLFVSPRTVQAHVANAMRKTQCANRTGLGVLAVREGLVPLFEQQSGEEDTAA